MATEKTKAAQPVPAGYALVPVGAIKDMLIASDLLSERWKARSKAVSKRLAEHVAASDKFAAWLAASPQAAPVDDLMGLYKTLCDLTAEANAVDTVMGRPRVLFERLAALRDQVGAMKPQSAPVAKRKRATVTVPEGCAVVPVFPTKQMIEAGRWDEFGEDCTRAHPVSDERVRDVWQQMIALSPVPYAAAQAKAEPLTQVQIDEMAHKQADYDERNCCWTFNADEQCRYNLTNFVRAIEAHHGIGAATTKD